MNLNNSDPKNGSGDKDNQPSSPPQDSTPYFPEDVDTTDRGQLTSPRIDIGDKFNNFDIG